MSYPLKDISKNIESCLKIMTNVNLFSKVVLKFFDFIVKKLDKFFRYFSVEKDVIICLPRST